MIRDRGNKKWTSSFMLPDHVKLLKEMSVDLNRQSKPILDEYQIQEFEERIKHAKEYKLPLEFTIYDNGFTEIITGKVHLFDQIKQQIKLILADMSVEYVYFTEIINVTLKD